jgi:hypothetical protein
MGFGGNLLVVPVASLAAKVSLAQMRPSPSCLIADWRHRSRLIGLEFDMYALTASHAVVTGMQTKSHGGHWR